MKRKTGRPKDLSDPTFNADDFKAQVLGGSLRWLATILAIASAGLLAWFLLDKEEPQLYFPIRLHGNVIYWVVGFALLVWLLLAIVNWKNWSAKKRQENSSAGSTSEPK